MLEHDKAIRQCPPSEVPREVDCRTWVDHSSSDSRREVWTFAGEEDDDDEEEGTYDDDDPDFVGVLEDLVRARRS